MRLTLWSTRNVSHARPARWLCTLICAVGAAAASAGPIPAPILPGGISVEVRDWLRLPDTLIQPRPSPDPEHDSLSRTKINFMREVPDGSGRVFVNDLRGPLYVVDGGVRSTYMDLGAALASQGQSLLVESIAGGFISFEFHPDFANAGTQGYGKFYTVHSEDGAATGPTDTIAPPPFQPGDPGTDQPIRLQSVITEWTVSDPTSNAFAGAPRELMRIGQFRNAHPVGDLVFDNDGLMYIAVGDGRAGGPNDRPDLPGRTDALLGSILRIDPLDPDGSGPAAYGVPADNPFVTDSSARPEVFATGFRNPHRLTRDADTGVLLVTDIGEDAVEEVNIVHAGGNYGWSEQEGTFTRGGGPLTTADVDKGFLYPVAQYDHDEGFAIAGGFVYRGSAIAALDGMFVFGDLSNGRIFYAPLIDLILADDGMPASTAMISELQLLRDGLPTTLQQLVDADLGVAAGRTDLRFGQTADGELFLMTKQDGWIRSLLAPISAPGTAVLLIGVAIAMWRVRRPAPSTNAPTCRRA